MNTVFALAITCTFYYSHGRVTYSGEYEPYLYKSWIHGWVALSHDLLKRYPIGTRVCIGGREYIVKDRMHRRWRRRADILMSIEEKPKIHKWKSSLQPSQCRLPRSSTKR